MIPQRIVRAVGTEDKPGNRDSNKSMWAQGPEDLNNGGSFAQILAIFESACHSFKIRCIFENTLHPDGSLAQEIHLEF